MQLINVLPWREKLTRQQQKKFFGRLMATALLIIVFASSGRFYLENKIEQTQQQLQQLQNISKTQTEKKTGLDAQQNQLQELSKQTQELELLDAKRWLLPQTLELLGNQLPDDLYLTTLQQKERVLHIEGRANNQQAITKFITLLTTIPEFKEAKLQFAKEIAATKQFEFAITQDASNAKE